MQPATFITPRTARFFSLGEPGPAIQHVWICLHDHDQPVAELAAQLVNLDTPERLLILPEALSRYTLPDGSDELASDRAMWFAPNSIAPDLADAAGYLEGLTARTLAACPAGTPVTVLGYGHGAVVACHWLATTAVAYKRLVLYAAVFPPLPGRRTLLAGLPLRPVQVVATTADTFTPEADGPALLQDLRAAGHAARLSYTEPGPLTLAALGAGREEGGLLTPATA
ncbi:hypothetical protein E4631_03630 [Hymenobacter sp. UV11]|uniref:hypothetical protein n=1 Tax=Hymenobacter sp. UV11 TaxID=1849735 RepID=UPI00105FA25C|nr:hypothetical protein [Hymenobacter sp. UV11]TDN36082.1 hypothetical protein A8B98_11850 [Hymenobacter sp. UV11]TFZ68091.1 hypothetical protein E4631_03630 [Hymenobacter sp. UV11]